MPPRCKFTREEIVRAALELTRQEGASAVTARALGERLGASSRPIFSLFQSMQEVQQQVLAAADELYQQYIRQDMAAGQYPPYKASGMAYIRFAREERELFKLLFMRDRQGEPLRPGREMEAILPVIMKRACPGRRRSGSTWRCGCSYMASRPCWPRPIWTGRWRPSATC